MENADNIIAVDNDVRNVTASLCPVTRPKRYFVPCFAVDFINIFRDPEFSTAFHAAKIDGLSTDNKLEFAVTAFALHCIFNIPYNYGTVEFAELRTLMA